MENARFGTIAAAFYNSQRTKITQKMLGWTAFFQPFTSQRRGARSIEDEQAAFKRMKQIKESGVAGI